MAGVVQLSAATFQRIMRVVERIERTPTFKPRDRTRQPVIRGGTVSKTFLAKIMPSGPDSQPDYTDARYWVQEVDDSTSIETGALTLSEVAVVDGGLWVTAHNLVERGIGSGDMGGHWIRRAVTGINVPDRYVIVHEVTFTVGKKYVFESYPGQLQEGVYAYRVTCLDGECPQGDWFKADGVGFFAKIDPPAC